MSKRALALLVPAALVLALVASGCGGGGDEGDSASASITKSEFVAKADKICASANKEIEGEFQSFAKEHDLSEKQPPSEEQAEEAATTILIPSIEGQVEDIRALGAPAGEEDKVDEMLSSIESGLEKAKEDPAEFIEEEGDSPLAEGEKLAHEYGLKHCGGE